ncbi:MAG TPA: [protein-PII] uridylyltransferase [Polyangiaceae bacterium]|jgi:[protein-PII] uridylyltransferase
MSTATEPASTPLLERAAPGLVEELKAYITRHRRAIETTIREAGDEAGEFAGARYAKAYDGLLCSLFKATESAMGSTNVFQTVGLAAVGSYGRGALAFHSDLDVRLISSARTEKVRPVAEALLYPLWDAGLSIGHQVVSGSDMLDLAKNDLPTATSLLDWRVLVGDKNASEKMLTRAFDGVFGAGNIKKFLDRLESKAEERSERFGGSVYLLEPDVKNGIGGLRDIDLAHWAARARWRVSNLSELVRHGVLLPREWQQIEEALALLWRVRNLLHVHAGRRSDRLSFDRQETLAVDLGYGPGGAGVEAFMSDYYQKARVISRVRELVLSRAAPPPKRRPRETSIGRGLKLTNEQLSFEDPAQVEQEPALALRLYDEAVRRDLPVYPFARDLVARALTAPSFCDRLRASEEATRLFVRLVTVVQRTKLRDGSVLKDLHDIGLLVAMIPEFAPVVGRVHHDVYHVYTVDVHSVAAVDRLRALCRGELAGEHRLASRLAAEISRPNVLFFAALLHDIGKDIGGKNHDERGREMARGILERLAVPEADIREIQHLIWKHLRMYHVATRRDIDDPRTLEAFAEEVHGREGLRELYMLTICDVSTTSPTALTSWKARVLEELYVGTDRQLSSGRALHGSARAEEIRSEVRALCPQQGELEFLNHFLAAMPERYLYANDAQTIVRHSRFARQAQMKQVNVTVMTADAPYVELGFVADDRPGLLAMITATLTAARFKVISAQVYSWVDSFGRTRALDLFWVRGGESTDTVISAVPRLERDFNRLLSMELSPAELVTGGARTSRLSDRPTPKVPTEVSVDNRCATDHSVIEVTTKDQLGLLFWLANSLQHLGLQISLAKINTEGTQVADVFYVTEANGSKVSPERIEEIQNKILSSVAHLEKVSPS